MALWIGIDPGDNTGVAVWDSEERRFESLQTMPLHRALAEVERLHNANGRVFVVFEDARQRRWFEPERNAGEYRGKLMGAGAAKRDAKIWEEFLDDMAIPYIAQKPQVHGTKWSAEQFAQLTGWEGRSSNHARDAALLVYGRS